MNNARQLARSSVRPGCRLSKTEADGFCCSRKNPFWLGKARCTRAFCTEDKAWMDRVSSPSKPALEGQPLLKLGHAKAVGFHHLKTVDRALGQAQATPA